MKLHPRQFGIIHLIGLVAVAAVLLRFPAEIAVLSCTALGVIVAFKVAVFVGLPFVMGFEFVYRRFLWRYWPLNRDRHPSGLRGWAKWVSWKLTLVLVGCVVMFIPEMAIPFFGCALLVALVGFSRMIRGEVPFQLEPTERHSHSASNRANRNTMPG